jgi:2-polyprenyl-6-methoxyphenol hydroxylase-like FAD-dependent oxidoreductase
MKNILISGASVAGLSLAHWLRQYGFVPTLVEKAPALRPGGQAVDIRGTAREVVTRMGVMDAIHARHTGTRGIAFVAADGRWLASMAGDAFGDSNGIVAELEILRSDLVGILHEAAGPDLEVLYDDMITGLADDADGVRVSFGRNAPRTFDLVVGADGLGSGVRGLAFGADAELVRDHGYYTAYYPAKSTVDFEGWELMYNMPAGNGVRGRVAIMYPLGDTGHARVMLAFVSPEQTYDRGDVQAQKRLLADVFAGAGWELPGLIEQLWQTDDLYFARAVEVRIDEWYRGRTALLGDAAFGGPMGMGTSMALVGAYVLAGELAAASGDHRVAFPRYDAEMRVYVTRNRRREPGGTRGFAPSSRFGIWLRNRSMNVMTRLPGAGRMMAARQEAVNAITLKAYP